MCVGLGGLFSPSTLFSETNSPHFQLTSYVGSNLAPESPNSSLTLEPLVRFTPSDTWEIDISSSIDRPFDPYQNFAVPKTDLFLKQVISRNDSSTWSLRYGLSFPDFDRWKLEGYQVRPNLNFQISLPLSSHFSGLIRAGSFFVLSQYTQHPNGENYAKFGFTERVSLLYRTGIFAAEATVTVEQSNTGIWKNDYGSQELISFEVEKHLSLGLMHELLAESIDSATGFYRPIRVFDGRDSRVSAFMEMKI
jgi:hypothetical protein